MTPIQEIMDSFAHNPVGCTLVTVVFLIVSYFGLKRKNMSLSESTFHPEVGDFVRPSDRMTFTWAKEWGSKPRQISQIRKGMNNVVWYSIYGFGLLSFKDHELDFVRKPTLLDKIKKRLTS
jgi:hypothetical protein